MKVPPINRSSEWARLRRQAAQLHRLLTGLLLLLLQDRNSQTVLFARSFCRVKEKYCQMTLEFTYFRPAGTYFNLVRTDVFEMDPWALELKYFLLEYFAIFYHLAMIKNNFWRSCIRTIIRVKYRESPLSTVSLSTVPGLVRFQIVLNSMNSSV